MKKYLFLLLSLFIPVIVYAVPVSWEGNFVTQLMSPLNSLIGSHVGIGTSTPGGLLSIHAPSNLRTATNSPILLVASSTASATTTFVNLSNTGSTTFWGILNVGSNFATSTGLATSTFNNGIRLTGGCFQLADGTCAGTGGGSGTINSGTTNRLAYYSGATTLDSANFLTVDTGLSTFTLAGNLLPSGSRDIGASGNRWANGYFTNLDTVTVTVSGFASGNLTIGGDMFINGNDINLGTGSATSTISGGFGIGVGTTTPGAAFAVATSTAGLNTAFLVSNLGSGYTFWAEDAANDTTPFVINNTGNIGISTTSPGSLLSIHGAANFGPDATSTIYTGLRVSGINATSSGISITGNGGLQIARLDCTTFLGSGKLTTDVSGNVVCDNDTSGGGGATVNTGTANRLAFYSDDITISSAGFLSVGNIGSPTPELGIGTTTPWATLHIVDVSTPQLLLTDFVENNPTKTTHWFASTTLGNLGIGVISNLNAGTTTYLTIASTTGRLGIGTTTPGSLLSVQAGNAQITGTTTAHALLATSTLWVGATGNLFNVLQSGNVGIGTTSPSALFSVVGSGYLTGGLGIGLINNSAGYLMTSSDNGTTIAQVNVSAGSAAQFGSRTAHNLQLLTNNTAKLTIDTAGNVGIGLTSPAEILDIVGAMHITPQANPPTTANSGDLYMDSTPNPDELCVYDGTGWQALITNTDTNCQ